MIVTVKECVSLERADSQTLTWYHVILFPVFGSLSLLLLFYFFDYIQFVFIVLTLCAFNACY